MALKMNAAVVEEFGKPLVLREREIPSPAAGEILIKTEACGVCHTDLLRSTKSSTGSSMVMWRHAWSWTSPVLKRRTNSPTGSLITLRLSSVFAL